MTMEPPLCFAVDVSGAAAAAYCHFRCRRLIYAAAIATHMRLLRAMLCVTCFEALSPP